MTALLSQVGLAKETAYGTAVTPSRFFEFTSEGLKPAVARLESKGIRTGARAFRNDRSQPVPKGAAGSIENLAQVLNARAGFARRGRGR